MEPPTSQALLDRVAPTDEVGGSLLNELDALKRREEAHRADLRRMNDERRLAAVVQRDLLPQSLPLVDGLDIRTLYRPADIVSGDIYDVSRIDESHIAISLVDATGHGLAAALLAASVKRSLRGYDVVDGVVHRLAPDKVLARLNTELVETQLRECFFVAALHAVYNERTRVIRWARGGASYPVLARRGEEPRQVKSTGPLVGLLPRPDFEIVELKLEPGDRLVFHTDGVGALLEAQRPSMPVGDLTCSTWFAALGRRSADRQLAELDRLADATGDWRVDDITAVALQLHDEAEPHETAVHAYYPRKQVPYFEGSATN